MLTFYPFSLLEIVINVIAWILTGFAGLICIGHIVFQSVMATQPDYGRKWLPDDSTLTLILQYVGVQRYVHNDSVYPGILVA